MIDSHRAAQLAKRAAAPTAPAAGSPGELPPGLEGYITPEVVEPPAEPAAPAAQATVPPATTAPDEPSGPLDPIAGHVLGRHTRLVFDCWVLVFGLVRRR